MFSQVEGVRGKRKKEEGGRTVPKVRAKSTTVSCTLLYSLSPWPLVFSLFSCVSFLLSRFRFCLFLLVLVRNIDFFFPISPIKAYIILQPSHSKSSGHQLRLVADGFAGH